MMSTYWKKFIGLFTVIFKIVEEHKHINTICSIGKNTDGYTIIEVMPIGAAQACMLFPHQIIDQALIKKQFTQADIKLIKGILITEGDIFIESKEYRGNDELYFLRSLLDQEKWMLTSEQINAQKQIFNRINKRFFANELSNELLAI